MTTKIFWQNLEKPDLNKQVFKENLCKKMNTTLSWYNETLFFILK